MSVVAMFALGHMGCDRVFQLLSVEKVSGDAGETADDSDAPDGASSTTCLSDDFSAPAIGTQWTVEDAPSTTVSQTGGFLVFTLSKTTGVNYALIKSSQLDLTNDAISVEVIDLPTVTGDAEAGLSLQLDSTTRYQAFIARTTLVMRMTTPTDGNIDTSIVYSSSVHRFLRMRHVGTDMLWETSPDGMVWTVRRTASAEVDVANLRVMLFAGTYKEEGDQPGQARFDNVRVECLP